MSNVRNIEDLKLEEVDEEFLRNQCIEMGMELEVDTRQGSIYRDAAEGHIIRAAKFFDDLRMVSSIISISTCTGDVLDEKLKERGLTRNPPKATPARYYCFFQGTTPQTGDALTCDGLEFTVDSIDADGRVIIVSKDTGKELNDLPQGIPVIPEIDADGLISCTLEEIAVPAQDAEDDESARQRLINKVSGPDENGNASQICSWCESVSGVGRARVIPLWNGPTTVKAVIIGTDGHGASESVVSAVQEYIDPGISGMGEGKAAIGQFVTVSPAADIAISISVSVVKTAESSYSGIKTDIENAVREYLKTLAMETWSSEILVRYNRISSIITGLPHVIDHENLRINGGTENVSFTITQVPVLGEVTVNGDIL